MNREEGRYTEQVIKWAEAMSVKYPELSALTHYPAEVGDRSSELAAKIEGAKLKRMGKRKGYPDLFLNVPKGEYAGLFIELKAAKGKPSKEQIEWLNFLNKHGNFACICIGAKQAAECLEWYVTLKTKKIASQNILYWSDYK